MDGAEIPQLELQDAYGYEETLMHGRYLSTAADYAKEYAKKLKYQTDDEDIYNDLEQQENIRHYSGKPFYCLRYHCRKLRFLLANDYTFLLILGILMAFLSFGLDFVIQKFQLAQIYLYRLAAVNPFLQYIIWVLFPLLLITFSVGFVHLVSPRAIGSGIPEMKVILRGTNLKRYLSFQTFVAKTVGLMTAMGSGIPIGKEGPFVHISSMLSRMLSKFIRPFQGIYANETRNVDMLSCACALGVSSSFASPIGGVLFSIEVTSTYFAVRNYWKGFFAAVCGAFTFRLFAVWNENEATITALFKTNFNVDFPFDTQEFVAFAFIGLTCGFGGALFVYTHRKIVDFHNKHETSKLTRFLAKSRFLYPALIVLVTATLSFPKGLGMFMAGQLTSDEAINDLFSNTTWSHTSANPTPQTLEILSHWESHHSNIYATLVVFIITKFLLTALCIALPVPAGMFYPVFIIGAAYGRLVGECMATWFPDGVRDGNVLYPVLPGGYAVVGAAALAGAVTHTISTSVIIFELTGQITHILPVIIAVLIANAVVQPLQPSIYDSIIDIQNLPNIPDIKRTRQYNVNAGDIMSSEVPCVSTKDTYMQLRSLLISCARNTSFALVDTPESMILLGSVQRPHLENLLQTHMEREEDEEEEEPGEDRPHHVRVHFSLAGDEVNLPSTSMKRNPVSLKSVPIGAALDRGESTIEKEDGGESSVHNLGDGQAEIPTWELERLGERINFTRCQIDPSPFQLVENTSLYKVHKLFCLLNLSHAYVTALGRLVGIVSLDMIREALNNERPFIQRRISRRQRSEEGGHAGDQTGGLDIPVTYSGDQEALGVDLRSDDDTMQLLSE